VGRKAVAQCLTPIYYHIPTVFLLVSSTMALNGIHTGWVKMSRTEDLFELIAAHPNAFRLASIMAIRSRWKDGHNRHELRKGECFLGDYENCGMSSREYRTAKDYLARRGFATFKTTNKGTIGRLLDNRLFTVVSEDGKDVMDNQNDRQNDRQPTNDRLTADTQPTTNEDGKTEYTRTQRDNDGKTPAVASDLGSQGSYFDEEYLKSLNLPESTRRRDAETRIDPESGRERYLDAGEWVSDFQWPMLISDPRHPMHRKDYVPPLDRPVDPAMKALVDVLDPHRPFVNVGGDGWQDQW